MNDKLITQAWKDLMSAVIQRALDDLKPENLITKDGAKHRDQAWVFLNSEWCQDLCWGIELDYPALMRKAEQIRKGLG